VGFFNLVAIWSLPERDSLWVSSIELQSRACTRKLYMLFARFVLDPESIKNEFLRGYEGLSLSWSFQEEIHWWICFSHLGFWKLAPRLHRTLSSPADPAPVVDPYHIPGLAAFHPSSPPFGAVVYDSTGAGVVGLKSGSTTDQNLLCFIKFMIAGCVSVVGI
jgi:hypothetical protein